MEWDAGVSRRRATNVAVLVKVSPSPCATLRLLAGCKVDEGEEVIRNGYSFWKCWAGKNGRTLQYVGGVERIGGGASNR